MTTRFEALAWSAFSAVSSRFLSSEGDAEVHAGEEDAHSSFGVHITYTDLYNGFLFLTCIYVCGAIAQRLLKMPSLVGEIVAGILLGPPLADFVPYPEAFVLFGEIGLILLVLEAGIDIDLTTLKLIGMRGVIIAVIGSILPIGIGIGVAFAIGSTTKEAIAAGCAFGPTSLGIALNILKQGNILNTPVGQLIISAAVIDDMIALVILSQLSALVGDFNVVDAVVPIISALAFLILGGYIAVCVAPDIINKYILSHFKPEYHASICLAIMIGLVLALMPATYYAKASFLMGVFIAGLTFCRSHETHEIFVRQFKRLLQWLMRIFFAASIGFQVPIKDFGDFGVIWKGLLFTLALLGKLAVGFLVPNFNHTPRFTGLHLRDCLVTGFSMAAEGEFAFVIAVFVVDAGLISQDLYASIVLAVLLSTIIPPFLLRFTISYYNKKAEERIQQAAELEFDRQMDIEKGEGDGFTDNSLTEGIRNQTTVFLCIQTQSESSWGLLPSIMEKMHDLKLQVIDHRSWHPRGVDTTLVNEIYCADLIHVPSGEAAAERLEARIAEVQKSIFDTIGQENAKVKVQRWFPGVLEEIVEEMKQPVTSKTKTKLSVQDKILSEATAALEKKRALQTSATRHKSVHELLKDVEIPEANGGGDQVGPLPAADAERRKRYKRQKMRSTPVVGGGLFGERNHDVEAPSISTFLPNSQVQPRQGKAAELVIDGEIFRIRLSEATVARMRSGYSGSMMRDGEIHISAEDAPIETHLRGFVRNKQTLAQIAEETEESVSDATSEHDLDLHDFTNKAH